MSGDQMLKLLSSVALAIILSLPAEAANIDMYRDDQRCKSPYRSTGQAEYCARQAKMATGDFDGTIEHGDAARLQALIRVAHAEDRKVKHIYLNSNGGQIDEAVAMAKIIEGEGMETTVSQGEACVSACFIMFMAGKERVVSDQALGVAVHRAARAKDGVEDDGSAAATVEMTEVAKAHGAPWSVLGKIAGTDAADFSWLSRGELEAMNVDLLDGGDSDRTWWLEFMRDLRNAPTRPDQPVGFREFKLK